MPLRRAIACALLAGAAAAAPVKEIEVAPDPAGAQKQIYNAKFVPLETADYDQLVFECRLRQDALLPDEAGRMRRKPYDLPHAHIHREKSVRMVKDLDCYVSFWVPVGIEELQSRFGLAVQTNGPARVSRLKVTAVKGGRNLWSYDLPTNGVLRVENPGPAR